MLGRILSLLPRPHFMALAPLDVWLRVLFAPRANVRPAYWPKVAANLCTSTIGTVLTFPERLLLAPYWRRRAARAMASNTSPSPLHEPGFVFVLGYYRSGTTHLHYLLTCDPQFRTPAWCQCIAPQGFIASWMFLRLFLIPFLSDTRPQDDVPFGPDWPAEEDFALNNWSAASPLIGRFVVPSRRSHYQRFHDLQGLSNREQTRWKRTWLAFLAKQSVLAGRQRMILLKTPAHTARVGEILDLLGPENCRFVMITRDDQAVIKSNIAMQERLGPHLLEPAPSRDVTDAMIREEYASTMRAFERDAGRIPAGRLCRISFDELVKDGEKTLDRIYTELALPRSDEAKQRATAYLQSVRDYKPRHGSAGSASKDEGKPRASTQTSSQSGEHRRDAASIATGVIVALVCFAAWLGLAWFLKTRADWLIWPAGVAIGSTMLRVGRVGNVRLGVVAAVLTAMVYATVVLPATFVSDYGQRPNYFAGERKERALGGLSPWIPTREWEWYHIKKSTTDGVFAVNNAFWIAMGLASAYRFASRKHVKPPGK